MLENSSKSKELSSNSGAYSKSQDFPTQIPTDTSIKGSKSASLPFVRTAGSLDFKVTGTGSMSLRLPKNTRSFVAGGEEKPEHTSIRSLKEIKQSTSRDPPRESAKGKTSVLAKQSNNGSATGIQSWISNKSSLKVEGMKRGTTLDEILTTNDDPSTLEPALLDYLSNQWNRYLSAHYDILINIIQQCAFMYVLMVVLVLVTHSLLEAPKSVSSAITVILTCYGFVFQISRIFYRISRFRSAPMYFSLIAFYCTVFIFPNDAEIFFIIWWVSNLVVHIQFVDRYIIVHHCIFLLLLITAQEIGTNPNIVIVNCNSLLNNPTQTRQSYDSTQLVNLFSSCIRFSSYSYVLSKRIVFYVSAVLIFYAFLMFIRYYRQRTLTLIIRTDDLKVLTKANAALTKELATLKRKHDKELLIEKENLKKIDLNSPLYQAIVSLQQVRAAVEDPQLAKTLTVITNILSSNKLFDVDLDDQPVDRQIHDWLNTLLQPKIARDDSVLIARTPSNDTSAVTSINLVEVQVESYKETEERYAQTFFSQNFANLAFDSIEFCIRTEGAPLKAAVFALFEKHKLLEKFSLDPDALQKTIMQVQNAYYPDVPYHNVGHAVDVLQYFSYLLECDSIKGYLKDEDILSAFLAAIFHDMRHPGYNNNFMIQTGHPIALRYNDIAVLENFHATQGFQILSEQGVLKGLPVEKYKYIRELIVSMILATDMTMHFEYIGRIKAKLSNITETQADWSNLSDKKLMMTMMIKAADVSNPSRPWHICQSWTWQIMEEFFRQGAEEANLSLPISTFMNRETTDIAKVQTVRIKRMFNVRVLLTLL
jgi:hypothetical protein